MSHPAYDFDLITPEGSAFRGSVTSTRLPGRDGSFGILARHAPLLAALKEGLLLVTREGAGTEAFAVGEGFLEAGGGRVRALVDFCEPKARIDVARAERAKERAKERLRTGGENIDFLRAEAALRRAVVRLTVARHGEAD
jgi:F-type H+-transporting ATPase subunit epsilon